MSTDTPPDAIAAVNAILSEVIDLVMDVKQAEWKVPRTHEIYGELDGLIKDLKSWAVLLMAEDEQLGASPLESIPSAAGRTAPKLWSGNPTDDEVRRTLLDYLDRLSLHLAATQGQEVEKSARDLLRSIREELMARIRALTDL
jgi:hypothetical protein